MRPLILITNDDGIESPGLRALVEAAMDFGELVICAPARQQTAMGRAFPRTAEQGIIRKVDLQIGDKVIAGHSVEGSPAYAVAHGIQEIAGRKPDICLAGINHGENVGKVITASGTLGAVLEADSEGVPGIAFSKCMDVKFHRNYKCESAEWESCRKIARFWIEKVFNEGFPKGAGMLNINIPEEIQDITAYRITRQSRQNYFEFTKAADRDWSRHYELNWEQKIDLPSLEPDSDIHALCVEQVTSVTPLTWDMTYR